MAHLSAAAPHLGALRERGRSLTGRATPAAPRPGAPLPGRPGRRREHKARHGTSLRTRARTREGTSLRRLCYPQPAVASASSGDRSCHARPGARAGESGPETGRREGVRVCGSKVSHVGRREGVWGHISGAWRGGQSRGGRAAGRMAERADGPPDRRARGPGACPQPMRWPQTPCSHSPGGGLNPCGGRSRSAGGGRISGQWPTDYACSGPQPMGWP